MIFLRRLIFTIFILSCVTGSYAQEVKNKEPKEKKIKKKKKKSKKESSPKKEKTKKEPKEKKEKEPKAENEEGDDKNFGPIFDGASISVSAGVNIYYGDLSEYNLFPKFSEFNKSSNSAFKFSIAREIKWGLSAKLNYQTGKLEGTRKTGKNSSTISFENNFFNISLQPQLLISDVLFKKNDSRRLKIYANLGIGYMWYRSQQYDTRTLNTKDYEGYVEVEGTESQSQKVLSDKTAKAKTLTIPYGLSLVYKYNQKMDIHLDLTQSSTTTDRLDAFSRGWTAKDKYNYLGIGLTYNFNRTSADAPKKRSKKDNINKFNDESSNSPSATTSNSNLIPSTTKESKKGLFGKKNKKSSKEDELLNVRLKLFETQLKLFEMQYLLGK